MSGGSYDYLYCKDTEELFSKTIYFDDMAETLEKLNYLDVARDMRRLSEYIKSAYNRVDVLAAQLKPIMKAVEYYEDCDYGKDDVQKVINEYRQVGETAIPIEEIDNAPKVEKPLGQWKVRTADDGLIYYQCTVCWKNNFFEDFPFCPYCGASMKTGRLRKGNDNGKNL